VDVFANSQIHSSYGINTDKVNAIGLCRGDVKLNDCQNCLKNSTVLLTQHFQNRKEAIGWYDDEKCMFLRYSNRSIFWCQLIILTLSIDHRNFFTIFVPHLSFCITCFLHLADNGRHASVLRLLDKVKTISALSFIPAFISSVIVIKGMM